MPAQEAHQLVTLQIERGVARVQLNRQKKRNALSIQLAYGFRSAVQEITERHVTVAVLSAAGSMFSAGVDLNDLDAPVSPFNTILNELRNGEQFWIAEVAGGAAGAGATLALACPVVVMSTDAWLWLPELTKLGKFPNGVVRQLIPQIGAREAFRFALSDRKISAREALQLGWATTVHRPEELRAAVDEVAHRIASSDPDALRAAAAQWISHTRASDDDFSPRSGTPPSPNGSSRDPGGTPDP